MNRLVIGLIDEKFAEICKSDDKGKEKHALLKCFGLGVIEGVFEVTAIVGVATTLAIGVLALTGKRVYIR